jgi:hypothetical protein
LVYANRSTPTKTLTDYCNDLKNKDYASAYNELSTSIKNQLTESQFASLEDNSVRPLGGVSSCSVENVNDDGSTGTGTISYNFGNGRSGPIPYRLTNENGTWKITHEGNQ